MMTIRLLNIVTSSRSCGFYRGSLRFLEAKGFETALCSSPGHRLNEIAQESNTRTFEVVMEREIRLWRDLLAFSHLYRLMRTYQPTIVNAGTPKAGFLGMLAARLAHVPIRIYLQRGLRLETTRGPKRVLLKLLERLTCLCAHEVVYISDSLRNTCTTMGLAPLAKMHVLGAGSSNGVDTSRFHVDENSKQQARDLRTLLGIPETVPVVGFIGRFTRDKGIVELVAAFEAILKGFPDARLLLVGRFDDGDPIPDACRRSLLEHPQIVVSPYVADPKPYYALIDVLAFPTYREGFGNVAIEASAMEVPIVAYRVTGVVDSVQDGVSGTLVAPRNVGAFADALARYLCDPALRREHGRAGRQRVLRLFRQEAVWEAWHHFYVDLLRERGMTVHAPQDNAFQ